MSKSKIKGILPAIITPLDKKNDVDLDALKRVVRFLIEKGVNGFYPCGTTGEGPLLSLDERKKVAEAVREEANGHVSVMVHIGSIRYQEILELGSHALDIGADAVGVVTPFYYKYDNKAMFRFYSSLASKIDLPIYLYNIPSLTGNWLSIEVIERLAEENSNIVGMKDSSGDYKFVLELLLKLKGKVDILVGSETILLPSLIAGAIGGISGLANAFPEAIVGLYKSFMEGKMDEAWSHQERVIEIAKVIERSNYSANLKAILRHRGINLEENVKPPLRTLSEEEKKELLNKVETYLH